MSEFLLPHHHDEQHVESLLPMLSNARSFDAAADIFKLLGDSSRLRIFWLLCHCEECVVNISALVDMTSPAVSHHLRQLKANGLVVSKRQGKEVCYRASDTEQSRLLHLIIEKTMEIACPVLPEQRTTNGSDLLSPPDPAVCGTPLCTSAPSACGTPSCISDPSACDTPLCTSNPSACGTPSCTSAPGACHTPSCTSDSSACHTALCPLASHTRELSLCPPVQEELARQVHEYMLENLTQRITIEELSKRFHINTSTLKEVFKAVYGGSIASHMKEHRLEEAARLLTETDESIAQIAKNVGYESQSKFSIAFKEMFHVLPTEYRRGKRQ